MSKIVLTYEDKVEACKEYFNKFNKKPRFRDVVMYKNTKFKIGYFIQSIKQGYYPQNIRDGVINIFGSDAFDSTKDLKLTNEDKLNACRLFKQKFNRVPKTNDKMEFNNVVFNIGYFIHDIKAGHNSSIKPLVDEIFGCQVSHKRHVMPNDVKIDACKQFFNTFGRLPKYNETMVVENNDLKQNIFNIGQFIQDINPNKYNQEIKQSILNIFGNLNHINRMTNEEILELIKEYRNSDSYGEVMYKCVNIGSMIYHIKHDDSYKDIRDEVVKLLS